MYDDDAFEYDDTDEDMFDDRYLRGMIMSHREANHIRDEKSYCGFDDYSKFEDVLTSIENAIFDGTAFLGKKPKKKKR